MSKMTRETPVQRLFPIPALAIAAAAFAVIVPMFWFGIPSGHDFEFHMNSWMDVASQWQQGILYPRWAAMAHYGYGEPRFVFYPPASWMFGAGLGTVLPWALVPGVYIWAVLTAAGCSMFALARGWLPRNNAIFAAALYAANPYHVVIVYWRSAFAELMASLWLPLLLLLVLRIEDRGRKAMVLLALVLAAVWLTNAPAAVMVNYSLVLLVTVVAVVRRSPWMLLRGAAASVLGLALAGFYVLPAAYEEKWVNIQRILAPGVSPQANFLFTVIHDPDHNRFNQLVSIVAAMEIVTLCAAVLLSRNRRREHPELWWTLAAWGGAAALLMFPVTFILWEYLPQLRFVQLPWRWLLCLNAALVLLVAMEIRRWFVRVTVVAAMLAALAGVWIKVQPPWWDNGADVAELYENVDGGRGYEGSEEYVPLGANPWLIRADDAEVMAEDGQVQASVDDWAPESKSFSVTVPHPTRLVLHVFNYPAWKVEVNRRAVVVQNQPGTGRMVVPVKPGKNRVDIVFSRTRDRTAGALVSALALMIVILLLAVRQKQIVSAAQL